MGKEKLSKEQRKNAAAVAAFGSGKPPEQPPEQQSAQPPERQRNKTVGGVRRQGETKAQFRARMAGRDNSDIDAIFRGVQQTRTKVHKGLSGMPLNPDGTDPGNSFDRFMRQNPHLGGAAQRQAQYDQQARDNLQGNLQSAVAERKALQEMQNQNPNLVTGADGYRTLFDGQGKVIGTTKPMKSSAMWSKDKAINKGTATASERGDFAQTLQDTGMSSVASEIQGPKLPASMSTLFPGKSSPPGGGQGDRVGSSNPSGEPGGELFGQVPEFKSSGMAAPQYVSPDDTPGAASVAARAKAFPRERMQAYVPPYSSPEQLQALSVLKQLFGEQSPASAGLEASWTNMFKGQDDWAYLNQLFPDLVQPGVGSSIAMRNLQKLYRDPVYQSRF